MAFSRNGISPVFIPPIPASLKTKFETSTSPTNPIVRIIPTAKTREFWVEPLTKSALTKAIESSLPTFFTKTPEQDFLNLANITPTILTDQTFPHGIHRTIACADDVKALTKEVDRHEIVVITCQDWSAIPAENLLAVFQHSSTDLYAIVKDVKNAQAMFEMLEIGVDGCVLSTGDAVEVSRFAEMKHRYVKDGEKMVYETAKVVSVRPVGSGERVCVDTCSMLDESEGILVGTSSQALFHVLSEAQECSYVASRPFRVNAGPVHSYCLLPGGKTAYLSELCAGDTVLVTSNDGSTRNVIVGRAKIETRPLLLVTVITESGVEKSVFLQNAETVRVSTKNGPKSVTELSEMDDLLVRIDDVARHTGIAITEKLTEK